MQGLGLARGDRVAIMMSNVLYYPIAVAAVLRAGLIAVNVNPLYTPRGRQDSAARIARTRREHDDAGRGPLIIASHFRIVHLSRVPLSLIAGSALYGGRARLRDR
jgi:hypothetical protein